MVFFSTYRQRVPDRCFRGDQWWYVFQGNNKVVEVLKAGNLSTPMSDSLCGVDLTPGSTYVLSGRLVHGKAYVQLCDMVERWDQVSRRQRKGLRLLYRQSCQCEVVMGMPHPGYPVPSDLCLWYTQPWRKGFENEDCQASHAICMQQPAGHCGWTVDKFYRSCMGKAKARLP